MTLAKWLKVKKITQSKFAQLIGVSDASVSLWLNGSRIPRPKAMLRISKITGGSVRPQEFIR